MNKHAYLIMSHKDDLTFRTLVQLLDHNNNDIYIHMDKKVKSYDPDIINNMVTYSSIYHVNRTDVTWGDYTQIKVEMDLLEKAFTNSHYSFFHLLSGEDLPIKNIEFIYRFFEDNLEKNFIRFQSSIFKYGDRVRYYHYFQKYIGRNQHIIPKLLNKIFLVVQKYLLRINRSKNISFQKGTNWFSINNILAKYVINEKGFIESTFHNTLCGDEVFLQTIVHNSKFKDTLYHKKYDNDLLSIMRYIDWERGSPYTFKIDDLDDLIKSPFLFARKFDAIESYELIQKIKELVDHT